MITFRDNIGEKELQENFSKDNISPFWVYNMFTLHHVLAIHENRELVGYISLHTEQNTSNEKYGYIDMIELFPNKRGKGIGNETVEKLFDKTDWKDIHAEALSDAIPFWRKLGADFNMTDTKLKECCNKGYSADFTLHRKG